MTSPHLPSAASRSPLLPWERVVSLGGLRVEETGQGIASELVDKLFDPFFTKDEGEGTGLELFICQGIVKAHGGSIRAENVHNGGTAFVIQLGTGKEE